jgi:inorganic pyrophosphatase
VQTAFGLGFVTELVKLGTPITGQDAPITLHRSKTNFGAPAEGGPQNSGAGLLAPDGRFRSAHLNMQPGQPSHHEPEKLAEKLPVEITDERAARRAASVDPLVERSKNWQRIRKLFPGQESAYKVKNLRARRLALQVAQSFGKLAGWRDKIPGGKADKKTPRDFDQEQLRKGTEHELEHTDSRSKATEIAMDHLTEDHKYYDKLEQVEKTGAERCRRCGKKATCLVLWAEGHGGVPSCETHKEAIAAPFKKKDDFSGFRKLANDPIKKRVTMHGIGMGIEWKKGEKRRYYDKKDPKKVNYEKLMKADYGYMSGTRDHDGEQLDAYVGPNPKSLKVFVIKQLKDDGSFDEHKVMLGYDDLAAAKSSFLDHMPPKRLGAVEETDIDTFKKKHLAKAKEMRKAAGPSRDRLVQIIRRQVGHLDEYELDDLADIASSATDARDHARSLKQRKVLRGTSREKNAFVSGFSDQATKLAGFLRERIREGGTGTDFMQARHLARLGTPALPPGLSTMSPTAARQKRWKGASGSADAYGQQSSPRGPDEVQEPVVSAAASASDHYAG